MPDEPDNLFKSYDEFNAFIEEAKKGNGDIIRQEVYENTKKMPMPTEYSQDFVGMYVHGGHEQFRIQDHEPAFASFRKFSQKLYPIYLFYAEAPDHDDSSMTELVKKYGPVKLIQIPVLKDIYEYSEFMFFDAFTQIPAEHNNVLLFQHDGFFKVPGWEEFITHHDPDYIGAPWRTGCDPSKFSFKDGVNLDVPADFEPVVGNGGFSFRKRNKMLEVSSTLSKGDVTWEGEGVAEDSLYCYIGFGKGIFKDISPDIAGEFSHEPYNTEYGIGFHGFI